MLALPLPSICLKSPSLLLLVLACFLFLPVLAVLETLERPLLLFFVLEDIYLHSETHINPRWLRSCLWFLWWARCSGEGPACLLTT